MNSLLRTAFLITALGLAACAPKAKNDLPENLIGAKGDFKAGPESRPPAIKEWLTKDLELDKVPGTSADRAYKLSFAKAKVNPIIVAVVDSGVDRKHEDLKNIIWVNLREKFGRPGIDDDMDGFVDDVNGWNFLGNNKNGKITHIKEQTLEVTRESARMKALKAKKEAVGEALTDEEQDYYDEVTTAAKEGKDEADAALKKWKELRVDIIARAQTIASLKNLKDIELTYPAIEGAATANDVEAKAKEELVQILKDNRLIPSGSLSGITRLDSRIASVEVRALYYYNENFDPRKEAIGDNPLDFSDHNYGNSEVEGPFDVKEGVFAEASHGTHVAGIIAAQRNNGIGIDGIARDVRILPVRVVPDGDEADKDVANGIYYAVDRGAKIINMSFGKGYSPSKKYVDKAFEYAEAHGVLIIHAAGNDNSDNDITPNFPNRYPILDPETVIAGWLEIGASSAFVDANLPAVFSNFGKKAVHVFAPGVDVYSSVPGNQYDAYSGTSMASPSTAGVAALVWSQFPSLTAREVAWILQKSVATFPDLQVFKPGTSDLVAFDSLSRMGGVANAYRAMIFACEHTRGQNCK